MVYETGLSMSSRRNIAMDPWPTSLSMSSRICTSCLGRTARTLPDDLRLEGAVPVAGHLDADLARSRRSAPSSAGSVADVAGFVAGGGVFLVAQVLGQLLFRAVSITTPVSCLSSPSGPVRDKPCSRAGRTSSSAACSAVGSGFLFVTVLSVSLITAPFLLNIRLSGQCRNTSNYTDAPGLAGQGGRCGGSQGNPM